MAKNGHGNLLQCHLPLIRNRPEIPRLREPDPSRAEFVAGLVMARRGYTAEQIGAAIEAASPELDRRKAGHAEDYVERTVAAIMEARDEPPAPAGTRMPERHDTPGLG